MAVRAGLGLVPLAGIAFLWFIGVVRERLGDVEDRLFSTVFMGSGVTNELVSGHVLRTAAVFTLSVSTLGLRTAAMPRWLVLLGYAVALVLLVSPDGQPWVAFLFPGWVLLVSVSLLLIAPPPRPT